MFGDDTLSTVLVASLVVSLAAAGAGGAAVGAVAAQGGPSIDFAGVQNVTEGDTDAATVAFADVTDNDGVGSFTVNVTYDPDAVSVTASDAGAFTVETATPEPGVLRVTGYTDRYPGPTGNGSLFALRVTGDSATDPVTLGLETETFTDADGNALAVATGTATLAVEATDDGGDDDGGGGGGGGQPAGGASGDVQIDDRVLLNDTVTTGQPVVAAVNLSNYDAARGRITLTMAANGSTVAERTVAVGASAERTVYLSNRFDSPGTYALSVDGASVGSVTVEAGATPTATAAPGTSVPASETAPPTTGPTETVGPTVTEPAGTEPPATTAGDGAGFGIAAALVAVGLALLGARRLD